MRRPKIEVYQAVDDSYWWTLHSSNGKVIADSGEGYTSQRKAGEAARRVLAAAREAVLVVDGKVVDLPPYPVYPLPPNVVLPDLPEAPAASLTVDFDNESPPPPFMQRGT